MHVTYINESAEPHKLILRDEHTGSTLGHVTLTTAGMGRIAEIRERLADPTIEDKPTYYMLDDIRELTGALESLVDTYLANRGTPNEFVSYITPKGIPWYWVRAKQALERGRARLERASSPRG